MDLEEKNYPQPNKLYNIDKEKAYWPEDAEDFIYWGSEADKWAKDYARSYKAKISPKDFLNLTTVLGADKLEKGNEYRWRDLDIDEFNKEKVQPIFLQIRFIDANHPELAQVVGHEGRHRMFALMNAGVKEVDVELRCVEYESAYKKYSPFKLDTLTLIGQFNDQVTVDVDHPIPMSWSNHIAIRPGLDESLIETDNVNDYTVAGYVLGNGSIYFDAVDTDRFSGLSKEDSDAIRRDRQTIFFSDHHPVIKIRKEPTEDQYSILEDIIKKHLDGEDYCNVIFDDRYVTIFENYEDACYDAIGYNGAKVKVAEHGNWQPADIINYIKDFYKDDIIEAVEKSNVRTTRITPDEIIDFRSFKTTEVDDPLFKKEKCFLSLNTSFMVDYDLLDPAKVEDQKKIADYRAHDVPLMVEFYDGAPIYYAIRLHYDMLDNEGKPYPGGSGRTDPYECPLSPEELARQLSVPGYCVEFNGQPVRISEDKDTFVEDANTKTYRIKPNDLFEVIKEIAVRKRSALVPIHLLFPGLGVYQVKTLSDALDSGKGMNDSNAATIIQVLADHPSQVNWSYVPQDLIAKYTEPDVDEFIENLDESLLLEKTRRDLIDKSKKSDAYAASNQKKGKNRWERRVHSSVANTVKDYNKIDMDAFFKADILDFGIKVRGETDDYQVTITFEDALREIAREIKRNNNKLEFKCVLRGLINQFNNGNVYVSCTCPDWTYRQAYWSTKGGYNSGMPQPSNGKQIANPNDTKGAGCKHVNLCLANLDWMMKIASVINNYIYWARDNIETQYAKFIFPTLYGMPYDKAIQMTIDMYDDQGELKPEVDGGALKSDEATINMSNMIGRQRGQYKKKPEPSINPRYADVHKKEPEPEEETNELGLKFNDEEEENNEPEFDMDSGEQQQ